MGPVKTAALKRTAGLLPEKPGIYFFKNGRGEVVYIGKAVSLRDRVRSYFQPIDDPKVRNILAETADIDYILTGSEREAAFLENNFIRRHQPRFNLKLKDDKNFPFIKITVQDKHPGVYFCRRVEPDGARYFGPFSPAHQARRTIRLINKFFQVRACEEAVFRGRRRPCLEYDLHSCAAPCVGRIGPEEYRNNAANALLLLEGKTRELAAALRERMDQAARDENFEQAAHWRDTLLTIERLKDRPRLISVGREDQDIWGETRTGEAVGFLIFLMRTGRVSEAKEFRVEAGPGADAAQSLAEALDRFYQARTDIPERILLPFPPRGEARLEAKLSTLKGKKVRLVVPAKGKNKDLLDLASRNAEIAMRRNRGPEAALEEVRRILNLPARPVRIEGFDVSNTGGTETVASSVVFENGLPQKSEYKKYIIRTVAGPNDPAGLKEAVERRLAERPGRERTLPDLILVDGGRGQYQAAREALRRVGLDRLPLVALAKKEEIVYTRVPGPGLRLDRTSEALKLFQHVRDEAHRFAVSFHRLRRSKRSFESVLDGVPGIGPKKKTLLRVQFKSLADIRRCPVRELEARLGKTAAGALLEKLGGKERDHDHRDRD